MWTLAEELIETECGLQGFPLSSFHNFLLQSTCVQSPVFKPIYSGWDGIVNVFLFQP